MKYRLNYLQFIPDPAGKYRRGEISGDRIEIYHRGAFRKYWLLPDGTVSTRSIVPAKCFVWSEGRYKPVERTSRKQITVTVSGRFPFFRINETGDWVWLNADGSLTLGYVDFIAQANEFERLSRQFYQKIEGNRRLFKTRRVKREPKRVMTSAITSERDGFTMTYRWAVFCNGIEVDWGWTDDKNDAKRLVAAARSRPVDQKVFDEAANEAAMTDIRRAILVDLMRKVV